nr:hypothetical protein [Tanacetum cinerariifolium]GEZ78736.1 hypothetical protein [Tanacetum cinerariifolium]
MVPLNVTRFCRVYANIMRRAQASGVGDEDYYATTLLDYGVEHGMPFTLRHCWEGQSEMFEEEMVEIIGIVIEEALARLMVSEMAMHNERAMEMKKNST